MRRQPSSLSNFAPSGRSYNPPKNSLTSAEYAYLKAYLNGHHEQNYASCPGIPYSAGNKTVMMKTTATTTVNPTAGGLIAMGITGIIEAPIIVSKGLAGQYEHVVPYANVAADTPYTGPASPGNDYLKIHGIENYRCCSLSVKVEDVSAAVNRQGVIMSVRAPAGIDLVPIATSNTTTQRSARVLDSIPYTEDQMRAISNNVYIGPSEEGLYAPIPYSAPLPEFLNRDCPDNKAVYSYSTTTTDVNGGVQFAANILAYKNYGDGNLVLPVYLGNTTIGANPNSTGCIPCSPSNMMSQYILGTGLAATTAWRVSVVASWEVVVGANTDWADRVSAPMPTNLDVMALASDVFHFMPSAYPASANFWNDVWGTFKDVYRNSLSPLADMVINALPANYQVGAKAGKALLDSVTKRPEKQVPEKDPAPPRDMSLSSTIGGPGNNGRRRK